VRTACTHAQRARRLKSTFIYRICEICILSFLFSPLPTARYTTTLLNPSPIPTNHYCRRSPPTTRRTSNGRARSSDREYCCVVAKIVAKTTGESIRYDHMTRVWVTARTRDRNDDDDDDGIIIRTGRKSVRLLEHHRELALRSPRIAYYADGSGEFKRAKMNTHRLNKMSHRVV